MANQWYNGSGNNGNADLTNLGYNTPGGNTGVAWDPSYQPGGANANPTQSLVPGLPNPNSGAGAGGAVGAASASGTGYSIPQLVNMQFSQNNQARQQNQQNWSDSSNYLKQYANPLSPQIIEQMKSQNALKAQGGYNNAFAEQQGMMAANGQSDAGSLAAAAAQAQRNSLGAQIGANTNLGIQAAQINNTAGYNVGNSIISHLPQYKPDDYSGLLTLTNQMQNQQAQNALLQNAATRPTTPSAGRLLGPNDGNQSQQQGGGSNFYQPQQPQYSQSSQQPQDQTVGGSSYGPANSQGPGMSAADWANLGYTNYGNNGSQDPMAGIPGQNPFGGNYGGIQMVATN